MTLVGKIFTVLIFVMSIVYMGFAMAVYSAHRNWRAEIEREKATATKPKGYRHRLADAENEIEQLRNELTSKSRAYDAIRTAEQQQRAKLETELQLAKEQQESMRRELDQSKQEIRTLTASVSATMENLTDRTAQVEQLSEQLRLAEAERDKHFDSIVDTTELLHATHGEKVALAERNEQLIAQASEFKRKLVQEGIDPNIPLVDSPPQVAGEITAMLGRNMIEVSIGSDDGLRVGDTLQVYRAGVSYLGRAQVINTKPDKAAARLQFTKGTVQKGDRVATRLKVG